MSGVTYNVLFLCTGNSARSIMAESIMNRDVGGKFRAFSAGSHPKGSIDPDVLNLLQKTGYPTESLRSKSWMEFAGKDAPELHFVFTVCDDVAKETCPVWTGKPMVAHWSLPDPASFTGTQAEKAALTGDVMRMLQRRIGIFCALPIDTLNRLALQEKLDDIGEKNQAAEKV
jgi:arsenate reductase